MGTTTTLQSFPRLEFYSFFFFFKFFRKRTKMNLTTVISILCFVSLVAGIPSSVGSKDSAEEPSVKRKTGRMLFGYRHPCEYGWCTCPPGGLGERCGYRHPCEPCQNGGTCTQFSVGSQYFCDCPPGYTGRICESADEESEKLIN